MVPVKRKTKGKNSTRVLGASGTCRHSLAMPDQRGGKGGKEDQTNRSPATGRKSKKKQSNQALQKAAKPLPSAWGEGKKIKQQECIAEGPPITKTAEQGWAKYGPVPAGNGKTLVGPKGLAGGGKSAEMEKGT